MVASRDSSSVAERLEVLLLTQLPIRVRWLGRNADLLLDFYCQDRGTEFCRSHVRRPYPDLLVATWPNDPGLSLVVFQALRNLSYQRSVMILDAEVCRIA